MLLASKTSSLAGLLVAAAVLYLARDVLIPLALAILASFLLAPVVRRLEHWRLGRIPSTLVAVAVAGALIGGVGYVAAREALSLAAKLPEYRENIREKARAARAGRRRPRQGGRGDQELESEAAPRCGRAAAGDRNAAERVCRARRMGGSVREAHRHGARGGCVHHPHAPQPGEPARAADRPHRRAQINITTQALGEASYRVSRYLSTLLLVNACFGIPFGIALHFIGVPNAMLWGLLGTLLRFIPYAGVWLAVAAPALLAFAIFDGWSEVIWVLGTFLVLELILVNAIEPWLYGRSAGLSAIAVIAAALFWTWLWGPVGLLLAVPLTVCIAVMGRYIPEMGWLNMLLGVEPVLTPQARLYQRLIALDDEEAMALAHEHARDHGVAALYDSVIVPALSLAEVDRHAGALDPARERFVLDTVREIVEEIPDKEPAEAQCRHVCILPAHDEADDLAGAMLARLLPGAQLFSSKSLAAEMLECVGAEPQARLHLRSAAAGREPCGLPRAPGEEAVYRHQDRGRAVQRHGHRPGEAEAPRRRGGRGRHAPGRRPDLRAAAFGVT